MEEARAINRLMQEFGLSQEEIASTVGKSQSAVSRIIGLLNLDKEQPGYYSQPDAALAAELRKILANSFVRNVPE